MPLWHIFFPITYWLHWMWIRCLDSMKKLLHSSRSWQSWQAKRPQLWFRFCWCSRSRYLKSWRNFCIFEVFSSAFLSSTCSFGCFSFHKMKTNNPSKRPPTMTRVGNSHASSVTRSQEACFSWRCWWTGNSCNKEWHKKDEVWDNLHKAQ